jgi:hypothetical protein
MRGPSKAARDDEDGGPFPGNIGPTTRWEFGYYLQEYLKNPRRRRFIEGAPDDAQNVKWARQMVAAPRIPWHSLSTADKGALIPDSLIEAVSKALINHRDSTPSSE